MDRGRAAVRASRALFMWVYKQEWLGPLLLNANNKIVAKDTY